LEDNLRCPSGASYLLENRAILKRTFSKIFKTMKVKPVSHYLDQLLTLDYSYPGLIDDRFRKISIIVIAHLYLLLRVKRNLAL
jgi:uncharacterized circularly permuted ATP-grasp superfamily protein